MYLTQAHVQEIFRVIAGRFDRATVFVETMNPAVARASAKNPSKRARQNSSGASRTGKALAALLPGFRFVEEHGLTEGMAVFQTIYRLLDKLPAVRNISNRIVVLERG